MSNKNHNAGLQQTITELSKKLGVVADTSGNTEQLNARIETLKAQLEFAPSTTTTTTTTDTANAVVDRLQNAVSPVTEVTAPDTVEVKEPYYVIAEGLAVTSRRGVIGPGERVTAQDFANAESYQALLDNKTVVEGK